jgi:hypothetical protein
MGCSGIYNLLFVSVSISNSTSFILFRNQIGLGKKNLTFGKKIILGEPIHQQANFPETLLS